MPATALKGAVRLLDVVKGDLPEDQRTEFMAKLSENMGIKTEVKKTTKFGEYIAAKLKESKVTVEALAKSSGYDEDTLKCVVAGSILTLPKESFEALAKELKVEVKDMAETLPDNLKKMALGEEPELNNNPDNKEEPVSLSKEAEAIEKKLDTKYGEVIKGLQTTNEALTTDLKKERDVRVLKEFEEMAGGFGYKGEKKAEIAKTLMSAKENMDEANYKTIEETLKKSGELLTNSALFKELGSSEGGETNSEDEADKKAAALRKADPKLTKEQALDEVYKAHPELYKQYLDENPKQGGY